MSEKMYRAQILIAPEQHQQIRKIAERENRSISEVSRDLLAIALQQREREKQIRLDRILAAKKISDLILQERDGQLIRIDAAHLIKQARQERIDELGSS